MTRRESGALRGSGECLLEIRDQIFRILDAGGNANKTIRESNLCATVGGNRGVRHRRGMRDERFHSAKAFRERHQADTLADVVRGFEASNIEREHAPETFHLAFGKSVLRM